MRAPGKQLILYLLGLALGLALAVHGFSAEQRFGEDWSTTGMAVAGVILIPICAVQSLFAFLHAIGRRRLLRGENVIARWHVPAALWKQLGSFEPGWVESGALPAATNLRSDLVDRGIDIIVGTRSVLAGDEYYPLRAMAIPGLYAVALADGPDFGCVEFRIVYPRRYGAGLRMAIRLPFDRSTRSEAMRAHDHFAPLYVHKESLARRRPREVIMVSLVVALIGALAAAWGFGEAGTNAVAPLLAAVVGTILAPVALVLALITLLLARKRLRSG